MSSQSNMVENKVAFPVTEEGSHMFYISNARIKQADLTVGKVCLGYAFPDYDESAPNERVLLNFFGEDALFHSSLVQPHSKIMINVVYYGSEFPKLHMYNEPPRDKKWSSITAPEVFTNVTFSAANGDQKRAELVYMRHACGYRNVTDVEDVSNDMPVPNDAAAQ